MSDYKKPIYKFLIISKDKDGNILNSEVAFGSVDMRTKITPHIHSKKCQRIVIQKEGKATESDILTYNLHKS